MASHTVNLSDEAYRRLRNAKREGESFSDVVNRVLGSGSILDLVGMLNKENAEAFRDAARSMNRRASREIDRIAGRMSRDDRQA